MRISVFGLGYVGSVCAACLAGRGHDVIGVDINPEKVAMTARGQAPVLEAQLSDLTADAVSARRLHATTDAGKAIAETELTLVCVGTPSEATGGLSTHYLETASRHLGEALAEKPTRHTIAFRSTMLPGTCEDLLIPIVEQASGLRAGVGFGVCTNPEFLREGTGVKDFLEPEKTVIGELDRASGDVVESIYADFPGRIFRVPVRVAELSKYVDNSFHALKVAFANEVGALSKALDVDSHDVMDIFRADRKLNISTAYLRPGLAFGGSCLPKDLRALVHLARHIDVSVPLLANILASNEEHLRRTLELVAATGRRRVGIFGLAFKPGTDDLRESPLVELSERLLGKGYDVRIYDPHVSLAHLMGTNRDYIDRHLPHLGDLLSKSADDVLEHAEICVVGSRENAIVEAMDRADGRIVIDLVRLPGAEKRRGEPGYVGVGW